MDSGGDEVREGQDEDRDMGVECFDLRRQKGKRIVVSVLFRVIRLDCGARGLEVE